MFEHNQPTIPIYAYKKDIFFQKDDDIRVAFKKDKITITEGLSTKQGDKILNAVKRK